MKKFIALFVLLASYVSINAQHSLKKLSYPVNTDYHNEVSPVFNNEGSNLIFTRIGSLEYNKTLIINGIDVFTSEDHETYLNRLTEVYNQISNYPITDPVHSSFNQDVFLAKIKNDKITDVIHPGYPLNNALPNSICSVFGDAGQDYLLLNEFSTNGSMIEGFSSVTIGNNLQSSFPKAIKITDFKHSGQNINATISSDKQHLFLSMYNNELHNKDLYLSIKINDTTYSKPKLIESINTEYEEITPYISKDKSKLYFASNRPGGKGEYDIYYVERLDYSYLNWTTVKTFDPPLNTTYSESYPCIFNDEIFFTSDRDGTSDIFKIKTKRIDDDKINITVHIKATKEDGSQFPSEIIWGDAYVNNNYGYFRARKGEHTVTLNKNVPTTFMAENRSLITQKEIIDPQELFDQGINEITLHLILGENNEIKVSKIESLVSEESIITNEMAEGTTIVLHNIYFKRATSDVMIESYDAIKNLATTLKNKPNLIVSIDGHTDNVGDKNDLKELSLQRAKTIKEKLIEFGVKPQQVLTRGYGSDRSLNDNSTEELKQQNRRVEITILKNQ